MKSIISFFFLLFISVLANSQCIEVGNIPFEVGEKLTYKVRYSFGLDFDAGSVSFMVDTMKRKNKIFYKFISTGRSNEKYDWIFKVRDRYEVITFQKSLRPIYFHRKTEEGGYQVDNKYRFSYKDDKVYMTISHSDTLPYKDTISPIGCFRDALSSSFYLRGLDIEKLSPGTVIKLPMILDGKKYRLKIKYLGKEKIALSDTLDISSYKFVSETIKGSIFRGDSEGLFVWISADKNKVPVKIVAYILVGRVEVFLTDYKNLKNKPVSFHFHDKK